MDSTLKRRGNGRGFNFLFLGLRFLGAIPTMKLALDKALEEGEYTSSIFLSPKSDGSFRIIFILVLNDHMSYLHF